MGANGHPIGGELTERQDRWFATVRANLAARTGRSLDAWVAIARTCPHDRPRARVDWLRIEHGLGVNHAALVLSAAFPPAAGWADPAALRTALWRDPAALAILEAVERVAGGIADLVTGQRKTYTAFSRDVQFAAIRPLKDGRARLGLKLAPVAAPRLAAAPVRRESWSERLTAVIDLGSAAEVDHEIEHLFAAAAANGRHHAREGRAGSTA